MGSFGGHALPGSFFIIFGIWYTVRIYQMYYKSRHRNTRFTSRIMMDCPCSCLKAWPLEPFIKLLCLIVGFTLEIYTGMVNGKFVGIGNGQHATMFFFFGLTSVMDFLHFYKAPIPKDSDYISNVMAFLIEGLLFKFHLHGRTELDVLLHTLLIYVVFLTAVCLLVEMHFRHNLLAALTRSYLVLVQGTWFWQVGFILYSPMPNGNTWVHDNHEHMMIATMYFTWHCAVCFVFVLLIGAAIACCNGRGKADYRDDADDMSMKRLIHTGANGQTVVSLNDDSESDVEFQKPVSK